MGADFVAVADFPAKYSHHDQFQATNIFDSHKIRKNLTIRSHEPVRTNSSTPLPHLRTKE